MSDTLNITAVINGTSQVIAQINIEAGAINNEAIAISFANPIRIDKGTNVSLIYSLASLVGSATGCVGFITERS